MGVIFSLISAPVSVEIADRYAVIDIEPQNVWDVKIMPPTQILASRMDAMCVWLGALVVGAISENKVFHMVEHGISVWGITRVPVQG